MGTEAPVPKPILDQYGIFASHRKEEQDGTIWSQEPPTGVQIAIEQAKKSDIFFTAERPWEEDANLRIVTMLHEGGRYRMWYSSSKMRDVSENYVCYAESDDGFQWRRPELNQVEYEGSNANNIVSSGRDHHIGAIFIDPTAPASERYKAIEPGATYYKDGKPDPEMDSKKFKELLIAMDLGGVSPEERLKKIEIRQNMKASVSPDGFHWTNLDEPILDVGATQLDTHNLCVYDPYNEKYVAYLRGHIERRRLVRRAEGSDFRRLEQPRPCLMCDPLDSMGDDIYNPCYSLYPKHHLYLMFPSFYHRIPSTVDVHFAISRDSYTWTRPARAPIIDRTYDGGEYGALYAAPNLVDTGDGEYRLPFVGHERKHDFLDRGTAYPIDYEIRWAHWKEDRLAGLQADDEGSALLVERPCAGQQMRLNYRTEKDGWIKVELVNPPGTPPKPVEPFPGFSLDEAETLTGDELSRMLSWNGKSDLSELEGKPVAVRLHLNKAKVFATGL